MASMPLPIGQFREPLRLHRRDPLNARGITVLLQVVNLLMNSSGQLERRIGRATELGRLLQRGQ